MAFQIANPGSSLDGRAIMPELQATALTGTQNDFDLTYGYTLLRCTGASPLVLTGCSVDGAAPNEGDRLVIFNEGSSTVKVTDDDAGSTATYRFSTPSINGQIIGADGVMTCVYRSNVQRWVLQSVEPGASIAVAFSAGDYTATGSQTFTVAAGDLVRYAFLQRGKVLHVELEIATASVGGTPSTGLRIAYPAGFTPEAGTSSIAGWARLYQGAAAVDPAAPVYLGATYFEVRRSADGNFGASTDQTSIAFSVDFEVD